MSRKLQFSIGLVALAVLLVAGRLIAAPYLQPQRPPFAATVLDNANLRAGPATSYERVGGVQPGQTVKVTSCNDACDWYQLDNGAWIAAFLVQPQAAAPPPAIAALPTATQAGSLSPQNLVPALVVAAPATDVLVVAINGDAYRVRLLGIKGPNYGAATYDAATQANATLTNNQTVYLERDVTDVDPFGRSLRYVWLADGRMVNQELVRLGCATITLDPPDTKYAARLARAQKAAIEANRTCGLSDSVASPPAPGSQVITVPTLAPTSTPRPTATATATATPAPVTRSVGSRNRGTVNDTANLRAGPGTQYEIVGRVPPGTGVQMASCNETCDWYRLSSGEWIFAELVTVTEPTPTPTRTPKPAATAPVLVASAPTSGQGYAFITADLLNVRIQPGKTEPLIGSLTAGACVPLLGLLPEWANVRLPSGEKGWCWREYVTPVKVCPTPAPVVQVVSAPAAASPGFAAGCAATSVKANATLAGTTYVHECFGAGDDGLRQVTAGTPVEILGVAAYQPPASQVSKLGPGPFFKVRIWDGQVAWVPVSAINVDPAAYSPVSPNCEDCDRLDWAKVPRIANAPTPVPTPVTRWSPPVYADSGSNNTSGCCKICTTGKACGNSCISRSYTCHKGPGCACNG